MRLKKEQCLLYAVTDRSWLRGQTLAQQVEAALRGGVTMLQLREKNLDEEAFEREARVIQDLCRSFDVPFIINDNVELAKKLNADGVHVGQSDMPAHLARKLMGDDKIVGVTAKTVPQALEAYEQGADYLGCGAIYPTTTHVNTVITPVETLKDVVKAVPIPVNAIGGLNKDNIFVLKGSGIAGICVVSAIMKVADPETATRELKQAFREL